MGNSQETKLCSPPPNKLHIWTMQFLSALMLSAQVFAAAPEENGFALPSLPGGETSAAYCVAPGNSDLRVAGMVADSSGVYHLAAWKVDLAPDTSTTPASGLAYLEEESWAWACARTGEYFFAGGIAGRDFRSSPYGLLAKFGPGGGFDPGFGDGGVVRVRAAGGAGIFAVAALPGGGVAAGGTTGNSVSRAVAAVWEFSPDGSPRPDFGKDGMLELPVPDGTFDARVSALLASGHELYAAGTAGWDKMLFWKISEDGKASLEVPAAGAARGLAARAGDIFLAGFRYDRQAGRPTSEAAVLGRLSKEKWEFSDMPSGDSRNRESFSIAVLDERVLAAGYAYDGTAVRAAVWSFGLSGKPEAGFGDGGLYVLKRVFDGVEERVYYIAAGPRSCAYACGLGRGADKKVKAVLWKIKPVASGDDSSPELYGITK